jgi:hypothetical protein
VNAPTTLLAYAAALAVVFGVAAGVGMAVGPVGAAPEAAAHGEDHAGPAPRSDQSPARTPTSLPAGLSVTDAGYTLQLEQTVLPVDEPTTLAFRIIDDGTALRDYAVEHEKDLHLIVVRRDATGFQHLHPERDADGRWTTRLRLPEPGSWKVLADFTPADADGAAADGLTLAADLTVPGPVVATPLPAEQRTATVDGYTVRLTGRLVAGTSSRLALSVSRDGRPVDDLEPYLGAYGHLVALRDGDLAYLHVHPDGPAPDGPTGGPEVVFTADVPSAATYRLFLDFAHDGQVRTASFSLPTASDAASPAAVETAVPHGEGHDHG